MADRRYIAQDVTDSGQVEQLVRALGGRDGFWAAAFFSWLIPFWDDDGRLIGSPHALRSKILARYQDLVSEVDVAEAVALMNDIDLVIWYEVVGSPGERYLFSPRFTRHQTLRADRYGPSRHPAPPAWTPDTDHPYGKDPELRKRKPQRDTRKTARVAKRPVIKGGEAPLATTPQPPGNQSAPTMAPSGDEASRHPTSPHASSPHVTPQPSDPLGMGTDELRSGATGTPPEDETELERCMRLLIEVDDPVVKDTLRRRIEKLQAREGVGT